MKKLLFLLIIATGCFFTPFAQGKDKTRPRPIALFPPDDAGGVLCSPQCVITFNEIVNARSGFISLFQYAGDSLIEQFDVTTDISGSGTPVIAFSVTSVLAGNNRYYLTVEANSFRDTANNLFSGLTSKNKWNFRTIDNIPPRALVFSPPNNGMSVQATQNLVITFDKIIRIGTGSITLYEALNDLVFERITLPASGVTGGGTRTVTIDPAGAFAVETAYYVFIDSSCFKDTIGNPYAGIHEKTGWNFTTRVDPLPPLVTALFPADNAAGVATNAVLTITFNENVMLGPGDIFIRESSTGAVFLALTLPDSQVTANGTAVITINPLRDFAANTAYHVLVDSAAITDLAANRSAGIYDAALWNFTTGADNVAPVVIGLEPPDNAVDVGPDANLAITFSEPVNVVAGTFSIMHLSNDSALELIGLPDARVTGTGTSRITVNPGTDFTYETPYYMLIGGNCFSDMAGNRFAGLNNNQGWNFSIMTDPFAPGPLFRIEISPETAALAPGDSAIFTASGYDSAGRAVTLSYIEWACDTALGTIDSLGRFRSVRTGTGRVIALADLFADTVLVVVHGGPAFISVIPDSFVMPLDSFILFRAMGHDSDGNAWAVPAQWVGSNGGVDSSGRFQPSSQGACTVSAVYQGLADTARGLVEAPGVLLPPAGGWVRLDDRVSVLSPPLQTGARIRLKLYRSAFAGIAPGLLPLDSMYLNFQFSDTSYVFAESLEVRIRFSPGDSLVQCYEWRSDQGAWFRLSQGFWSAPDTFCFRTPAPGRYLLALDTVAPLVTAGYDTGLVPAGTPCTVTVRLIDNVLNNRVSLFYRQGGLRTYQAISTLAPSRDTTVSLTIPGGLVNSKGLSFYLSADDGGNTVSLPPANLKVSVVRAAGGGTLPFDQWRLISFPLLPSTTSLSGLLFDDLGPYDTKRWRMFDWDGLAYGYRELQANTALQLAHSYWIRTRVRDITIDADSAVTGPVSDPLALVLRPGWNAVSVPFAFAVDWQDILGASAPDSAALLGPYFWNGSSWENPMDHPTLLPWNGYYVKNLSGSSLNVFLPPWESSNVFTPPKALPAGKGWLCRIAVSHEGAGEANDYFGVGSVSGPPFWRRQYPEPPLPQGMACLTAFLHGAGPGDQEKYMSDIRDAWHAGQCWTYTISRMAPGGAVALNFTAISGELPGAYSVCVYDPKRNHAFTIKDNDSYRFYALENETARTLKIMAGDSGYIAGMVGGHEGLPAVLALHQAYPNPFNPATIIRYEVPAAPGGAHGAEDISIALFDFRGRKIATLARGKHDPGYYSAVWNGTDDRKRSVSSGTYLCRMTAGGKYRLTIKVMLLK